MPETANYPHPAPIDAYGNGGFRFAQMSHTGSILCLPNGIWAWQVTRPQQIDGASLKRVFDQAASIDILIVGTGDTQVFPESALVNVAREAGLFLEAMATGPAARTYNVLLSEQRRVAAALLAVPEPDNDG